MSRIVFCLTLCLPFISLGFFDRPVDYFRQGKAKTEERVEEKKEEKRDVYEELWKSAQEWFPETTNPLERAFYINPEDSKLLELLDRYYIQRQERASLLASKLLVRQEQREAILRQKLSGYDVVYFYRPECPYCRASEQYLSVFQYARQFLRVNVGERENARYIMQYGLRGVPTLLFMKDGREVVRWEGLWIYPSERAIRFLEGLP